MPIGAFLVAYGITGLAAAGVAWSDKREELAGYFSSGAAGTALIVVKALEVLLIVIALAGLLRRRDVWFLPALAGWMAGFAMFAVLDVLKGKWGGLLEHVLYLAGFVVLLFLSYGLSVKAQVNAAKKSSASGEGPRPPGSLTRTQEFALQAINRLPRR